MTCQAIPYTAYVTSGSGVTPIATATNTAGTPIPTGNEFSEPEAIAITPDGNTAYVANGTLGTVIPIATATDAAGTPITTGGNNPGAIAITPDGTTAYVANEYSGTVTRSRRPPTPPAPRSRSAVTPMPSRSPRTARPPTSPTTARGR